MNLTELLLWILDLNATAPLIGYAILSTALAAVLAAGLRLLRVRQPSLRHSAWLGLAVGMLVLPFTGGLEPWFEFSVPVPALSEVKASVPGDRSGGDEATAAANAVTESVSQPVAMSNSPTTESTHGAMDLTTSQVQDASAAKTQLHRPATDLSAAALSAAAMASSTSWGWLWPLYWLGLILMSVRLALGWFLSRRWVNRSQLLNDEEMEPTMRRILGRRRARQVELRSVDGLQAPACLGGLRPVILLPQTWRTWQASKRRAVLAHELSHIARWDYSSHFLALAVRCVYWFHPLAWWLPRHLSQLAERSCDVQAAWSVRGPHHYARVLLEVTADLDPMHRRGLPLAVSMTGYRGLKDRVQGLLDPRLMPPRSRPVASMALVVVLLVGLVFIAGVDVEAVPGNAAVASMAQDPVVQSLEAQTREGQPTEAERGAAVSRPAERYTPSLSERGASSAKQVIDETPTADLAIDAQPEVAVTSIGSEAFGNSEPSVEFEMPTPVAAILSSNTPRVSVSESAPISISSSISSPAPPSARGSSPSMSPEVTRGTDADPAVTAPAHDQTAEPVRSAKNLILLFDDKNRSARLRRPRVDLTPAHQAEMVQRLQAGLSPSSQIAVLNFSGRRLTLQQDFTADTEALLSAVERTQRAPKDGQVAPAAADGVLQSVLPEDALTRRHSIYQVLETLALASGELPTDSGLVFISPGFDQNNHFNEEYHHSNLPSGAQRLRKPIRAFVQAGTPVFVINPWPVAGFKGGALLAASTGGWYRNEFVNPVEGSVFDLK